LARAAPPGGPGVRSRRSPHPGRPAATGAQRGTSLPAAGPGGGRAGRGGAGQRRMHNANQIFRTPAWRKSDPDGALRIHPDDIAAVGGTDGGWMAVSTRTGRIVCRVGDDPAMRRGLVALPHGYGQSYPDGKGGRVVDGPGLELVTAYDDCDPIGGGPHH